MNAKHLRELLSRTVARYLKVSPEGLHLETGVVPSAPAHILAWSPARTLYRQRKPTCRSLDGAISITHQDRRCEDCMHKSQCTPQIRVDAVIFGKAYRLLLAYDSATKFLVYVANLGARHVAIEDIEHMITVLNRGRFGEVRFVRTDSSLTPPSLRKEPS